MKRPRALLVSLAVAAAAIAGVFALTSTVSLGSQARASTDAQVAQRSAQLDRYEASLRKALAEKPPRLPALPTTSASSAGVPSTAPARVVYQSSPPVIVGSSSGSDHEDAVEQEQEQEQEHGHESGGIELDD